MSKWYIGNDLTCFNWSSQEAFFIGKKALKMLELYEIVSFIVEVFIRLRVGKI